MSIFQTRTVWLCIAIMTNGSLNIATAGKPNMDLASTEKRTLSLLVYIFKDSFYTGCILDPILE